MFFFSVAILLLAIITIQFYYHRIKHQLKQKHSFSYYHNNNKLNKDDVNIIIKKRIMNIYEKKFIFKIVHVIIINDLKLDNNFIDEK